MPRRRRRPGSAAGGDVAIPTAADLQGLSPSERLRVLRAAREERAAQRAADPSTPPPEPEGFSADSARNLASLAHAAQQDPEAEKTLTDWLEENRGNIDDEHAEHFGLTPLLEAYDQEKPDDKAPLWKRGLGAVGGAIELITRPGQAVLEGLQEVSKTVGPNANDSYRERDSKGGWGDMVKALRGEERWDPVNNGYTDHLSLGTVLDRTAPERGDRASWQRAGYIGYNAFQFGGEVALDPLNLVGGPGKKGAEVGLDAAARVAAREAAETGAVRGATPRLAALIGDDVSEVGIRRALGDTGIRGLTPQARAQVQRELAENMARRTTRSGEAVELAPKLTDRVRGVSAADGAARRAIQTAERYDRGGLRFAGRTVPGLGRANVRRAAEATRLVDTVRFTPQADLDARLIRQATELADEGDAEAAALLAQAEDAAGLTDEQLQRLTELSYRKDEAVAGLRERGADWELADIDAERLSGALASRNPDEILDALDNTAARRLPGEAAVAEEIRTWAAQNADRVAGRAAAEEAAGPLAERAAAIRAAVESGDTAAIAAAAPEAGSAVANVRHVERAGLGGAIKRRTSGLAEGLMPRAGIRASTKLNEGTDELFYRLKSTFDGMAQAESARRVRSLSAAFKGVDPAERTAILEALDIGGDVAAARAALSEKGATALDVAVGERQKMYDELVETVGIPPEKLREADEYMARIFTDDGRKALGLAEKEGHGLGRLPSNVKGASGQRGHLKEVQIQPGKPILDVNASIKDELGIKEDIFVTDPAVVLGSRGNVHDRAVADARFFDAAEREMLAPDGGKMILRTKPNAAAEDVARNADIATRRGLVPIDASDGSKLYVHPDIQKDVEQVISIIESDEAMSALKNGYDRWNNLWGAYATVPLVSGPSFFSRNAQGNIFVNYQAGVRNFDYYRRAYNIQRKIAKAVKANPEMSTPDALRAAGLGSDAALVESALEQGALGAGFFSVDLPKSDLFQLEDITRGKRIRRAINPLDRDNALLRSGSSVNAAIEDNARLAHFMSKFDELGDLDAAGDSVKRYLFDYADLTDAERRVGKRVVRFYTYMRKNVPLQVRELLERPARINRAQGFANMLTGGPGGGPGGDDTWAGEAPNRVDGQIVPEWAAPRGGLLPDGALGTTGPAFARLDTPFASAVESLEPIARLASVVAGDGTSEDLARSVGNLPSGGPQELARIIVEEATGQSMFSGGAIRDDEGQRKKNAWLRLSQAFVPAADKAVGTYNLDDRATENAQTRFAEALLGVNVRQISDEDSEKSQSFANQELVRAIEGLKERGVEVPTIAELKRIGMVPDRQAAPEAPARRRRRRRG